MTLDIQFKIKNNPDNLYDILNTLYHLKYSDLTYGVSLYKNLCDVFSVKLLKNYITERFYIKVIDDNIFLQNKNEKTYLKINYSKVAIKSNKKYPEILKIFNIYNKRIFVIDFNQKNYFWLNEKIMLTNSN